MQSPRPFRSDRARRALALLLVAYGVVPLLALLTLGVAAVLAGDFVVGLLNVAHYVSAPWLSYPAQLFVAYSVYRVFGATAPSVPTSLRLLAVSAAGVVAAAALAGLVSAAAEWLAPPWFPSFLVAALELQLGACDLAMRGLLLQERRPRAALVATIAAAGHGVIALGPFFSDLVGADVFARMGPSRGFVALLAWVGTVVAAWRLRAVLAVEPKAAATEVFD